MYQTGSPILLKAITYPSGVALATRKDTMNELGWAIFGLLNTANIWLLKQLVGR